MTTQEMAIKYYELACQNKYIEIQHEFYGDNVISVEPEHAALKGMEVVTKGKSAVMAKGEAFREKGKHFTASLVVNPPFQETSLVLY